MAVENNPVVRWFLLFLGAGGAVVVIRGLRNYRSWLLLVRGTRHEAVIDRIELRTGHDGTFRKPFVTFRTPDGVPVTAAPPMYRKRYAAAAGDTVQVRSSPRDPEAVAVHGFCFRVIELIPVAVGLVCVAISINSIYS